MKRKILGLVSTLVCACLLFTGCTLPFGLGDSGGNTNRLTNRRRLVDFNSIEYQRPDVDALLALVAESVEMGQNAKDFDELYEAYIYADDAWEEFITMYVYTNIQSYLNVNDSFYDEEYRYLDDAYVELSLLNDELVRLLVEGEYSRDYRRAVGDYIFGAMEGSLELSDPAIQTLKQEQNSIVSDYNSMITNQTLEYNGREYTLEDIYNASSYQEYLLLYTEYYRQHAETYAEMYARQIELDKEIAEILGFDTAAEMYYKSYNRDYTPADTLAFAGSIKELFSGMVSDVFSISAYSTGGISYERMMDNMPLFLDELDGELLRAWEDMIEYNLYDYSAAPDKMNVGFTTYLYAYDAPYSYVYWTEDTASLFTVIHEFGHFFDNWLHYDVGVVGNLDISETYSQGLEVLALNHMNLFTRSTDVSLYSLGSFLESITYQTLLEEFQLRAYALEEVTAEALAALYTELQLEYGFDDYLMLAADGYEHDWYRITHLFEAPFYTISYATSATAALQIWALGQENEDKAVNTYLKMIHADQNQPFISLLDAVGLASPFEFSTLAEIADYFRAEFNLNRKAAA